MAIDRDRNEPRLDETMSQGVGNEPQPSDVLPEAVVGQGLGEPDDSGAGSGLGMGKARDLAPLGGTIPEHSGQAGRSRNGRGADRMARESIVDRDTESIVDRDTEIRRETDFRDATAHPLDPERDTRDLP